MRSEPARRQSWRSTAAAIREPEARDHIRWLVDNRDAYDALLATIRGARKSIWISQLAFDLDCVAFQENASHTLADGGGENLFDTIVQAVNERQVSLRVLLNSSILLNTKRALARSVAERVRDTRLVEVRGLSRFPRVLHAKMVIVDGDRAFLMGSPFVNGYWDSQSHPPADARRPRRELGGRGVHDVSVEVAGLAAHDIANCFHHLWRHATRSAIRDDQRVDERRPQRSAGFARVVTTEPIGFESARSPGSTETLDALLAGIRRATSLIYIEHQYLSSRPVVSELREALEREPSLEIVMLLNQNPDVTAYRGWQNKRLGDSGLLSHSRVGIFGLWTMRHAATGAGALNQVFVHSKVISVDDCWAVVGSANLDGASLSSYGDDFSGRLARRVFRDVRNFDVSLELNAGKRMPGTANPVRALRQQLWTEHLKVSVDASGAPDSKLEMWRTIAGQNVRALNHRGADAAGLLENSFILPYSTAASPRAQLADAGVELSESIDLIFEPGWVERNLSPNWFRNMFG